MNENVKEFLKAMRPTEEELNGLFAGEEGNNNDVKEAEETG